ncbi:MAG: UDP-galactopyranose mutase, partial [Gammaproteobacteria bacterium]|nr:UDP-galactopyranose mutase [Gammaproteobacteria bacterium]
MGAEDYSIEMGERQSCDTSIRRPIRKVLIPMDSLIVFSHLRWDFVYQRPQQLMTRLAKYYRIFYIEEPVFAVGPGRWHFSRAADNLIVCRPHTSEPGAGFHDEQLKALQPLVGDLIAQYDLREPLVWLYTPMALPLIAGLHARLVVYDCMDELSAFKNAPRQLLQREHALLKISDIVFTGGPSLYAAKRSRHDAVFCFPSSVEREHFAHARKAGEIRCQQHLGHPRLGFFGVIDERLDINLLNRLAIARPTWQIVLVGPVVKIDPASLPRHPNIHYFGQQTYADLPRFLAGWDICLLPFALNEATRFISPTKTLEYMASEKPIVSTSVPDVVGSHGDAVRIGDGAEFLHQCDLALTETPDEASRRSCAMRAAVAATSWDRTASQMHELMEAQRREAASHRISVPEKSLRATNDEGAARREPPVVIIGAGPTGLSAALTLGKDSLLLEQHATVGGWCRSIEEG